RAYQRRSDRAAWPGAAPSCGRQLRCPLGHAQVALQEARLVPEQVFSGRLVTGVVGDAGQEQHLVRATGGQQRAGQAQRVRRETLSSARPWISSRGRVSFGASSNSEQASYRSGCWLGARETAPAS